VLVPFEAIMSIFDPDFNGSGFRQVASVAIGRLVIVGVVQIELTAYFGVKVFEWDPIFGSDRPTNCTESTKFHVIWLTFLAMNHTFRSLFSKLYALGLVPMISVFGLYAMFVTQGSIFLWLPRPYGRLAIIVFGPLLWICVLIASTEGTIRANTVSSGENVCSFGQTFALLILVFPIMDIFTEIISWIWVDHETEDVELGKMREIPAIVVNPIRPFLSLRKHM
jgi:hypothetical protein